MILIYLIVCSLVQGAPTEHGRVIGEPGNGEKIPLDITLKKNYMISVSGNPSPPQPYFRQSTNLYDFDKKLEAVKIVEDDVCFIKTLKLNYNQMKSIVDNAIADKSKVMPQVIEQWNIPADEIKPADLETTVGNKIAGFCSGYRVFWMEEGHETSNDLLSRLSKRGYGFSASVSVSAGGHTASGSVSASGGGGSAESSASSSSGSDGSSASSSSGCR